MGVERRGLSGVESGTVGKRHSFLLKEPKLRLFAAGRERGDRRGNRADLRAYLNGARAAYLQMLKDILPSSDYVVDGTKPVESMVAEILNRILSGPGA